ncbi:MAG: AbrB/MazE/SpoVT family DNA-binding domain-containing protein [Armatimonadia bacterium]
MRRPPGEENDITRYFMGGATVGQRGQVVISAEARKALGIGPGDKLIVLKDPGGSGVLFVKVDKLHGIQKEMQRVFGVRDEACPSDATPAAD